jgi:hypothetical protein
VPRRTGCCSTALVKLIFSGRRRFSINYIETDCTRYRGVRSVRIISVRCAYSSAERTVRCTFKTSHMVRVRTVRICIMIGRARGARCIRGDIRLGIGSTRARTSRTNYARVGHPVYARAMCYDKYARAGNKTKIKSKLNPFGG